MMENLCIVFTMVLLFSYFLLNRIWPLQLWPSYFAKVIFLLGSTLIRNLLIIYHLFCFVRILCGYLWMHIELFQSVIYPIYKEYVPLYKIWGLLSLLMYFLLKPMSIKYIVFDLLPVPSSKLSGLISRCKNPRECKY